MQTDPEDEGWRILSLAAHEHGMGIAEFDGGLYDPLNIALTFERGGVEVAIIIKLKTLMNADPAEALKIASGASKQIMRVARGRD